MAYAVHHQRVPASGVEHGVALQLTKADGIGTLPSWPPHRGRLLCHAVLARDDMLRILEIRCEKGVPTLVQVRSHRLFGQVTGIQSVQTLASQVDGRDRLLVSFRDAKLALMEWDDVYGDLNSISIHTFERAPQLVDGLPPSFVPRLLVDPASRCAALLLPQDALAILPFVQEASELGADDPRDAALLDQAPYAPSFILSFSEDVDASIRNVRDCVFLPGFQKPMLAVLYEPELTWTGSLSRARLTTRVCFITLDLTVTKYPVTVTSEALPYDTLYLVACPDSLGGVLVVTPSALLHLDQTARLVGLSVSRWTDFTSSELMLPNATATPGDCDLQSSVLTFTEANGGLLVLRDGRMLTFQCALEGRTVTSLSLNVVLVPERQGGASFVQALPERLILCASFQDDTYLYAMNLLEAPTEIAASTGPDQQSLAPDADVDADALDLYGDSFKPDVATSKQAQPAGLDVLDVLPTLGPLNDMTYGVVRNAHGKARPHMVATMQHHLAVIEPRLRCDVVQNIAPAHAIWTVSINGKWLLLTAWDEECLVYSLESNSTHFLSQHLQRTIACGSTQAGVICVTSKRAEVLDEHGRIMTTFAECDANDSYGDASIQDSYVALWSECGLVTVWRYTGIWASLFKVPCTHADIWSQKDDAVCVLGEGIRDWLVCYTDHGQLALHSLPDGKCRWQSESLSMLPSCLDPFDTQVHGTDVRLAVARLKLCVLGDVPVLVVQYTQGQLVVYEARITGVSSSSSLPLVFVRVDAYMLSSPCDSIVPLENMGSCHHCIAVAGSHSLILVRDRKSPVLFLETDLPVTSFGSHTMMWTSTGVLDGNACLLAWNELAFDASVPYLRWSTGRTYTHVAVHEELACFVASSEQPTQFVLYNDEEQPVRDPKQDPTRTYAACGALELFVRVGEPPVHGYEFSACETVSALHMAPMDCLDRGSGRRTFVVVGTTVTYGEDRSSKGHMYVFDVVECVPSEGMAASDALRLQLLCTEEMRAPVTALHDLNGFLVAAVGQKLLIRSWEYCEWLVTVAFLDMGMYTTSIQRVKNFLLLTDYYQSAYFVAFQEDPARLVLLGRDYIPTSVTCGAFLIDRARLSIVTCDMNGCLRLMDYHPSNPTSLGGQRLLARCEYHAPGEVVRARMLHGPYLAASGECLTSEIVLAKRNGAVDVLVPVTEKIFPTLQLFQSQLVRMVRHTAGLNPRGFRAVFNQHISRPLAKGILDGTLLHTAESMSRPKLTSLVRDLSTRTGGVIADDLLRCLVHLQSHW